MTDPRKNLVDFIVNTYPKRGICFHTSWSNCSLMSSQEEDLLNAVFAEKDDCDWFRDLPSLIFDLAVESNAYENDQIDAFSMFLADAMSDLLHCHVRDSE